MDVRMGAKPWTDVWPGRKYYETRQGDACRRIASSNGISTGQLYVPKPRCTA